MLSLAFKKLTILFFLDPDNTEAIILEKRKKIVEDHDCLPKIQNLPVHSENSLINVSQAY